MPQAVIDTTVLFAGAYRRDGNHDGGLELLQAIDSGRLPAVVVLDYVLAETVNGLTSKATHDTAVDFLDRLEANRRFVFDRLSDAQLTQAKSLFRTRPSLSLVDAAIVAYMQQHGHDYVYAFDDDFDGFDDIVRLESVDNPFEA